MWITTSLPPIAPRMSIGWVGWHFWPFFILLRPLFRGPVATVASAAYASQGEMVVRFQISPNLSRKYSSSIIYILLISKPPVSATFSVLTLMMVVVLELSLTRSVETTDNSEDVRWYCLSLWKLYRAAIFYLVLKLSLLSCLYSNLLSLLLMRPLAEITGNTLRF